MVISIYHLKEGLKMNILIVDDSYAMRALIKGVLEETEHKVIGEAVDGADGFEKYKKLNPDIVTLDITMPNVNGIECLKNILQYDENAKVIICSATGTEIIIYQALKLGAIAFFKKPFDDDEFIETLNNVESYIKSKK